MRTGVLVSGSFVYAMVLRIWSKPIIEAPEKVCAASDRSPRKCLFMPSITAFCTFSFAAAIDAMTVGSSFTFFMSRAPCINRAALPAAPGWQDGHYRRTW